MEKWIEFTPAYDKRDPVPAKNYGIGCVDVGFYLRQDGRAVQFKMYTGWYLPQNKAAGLRTSDMFPMAADLGYHSPVPSYEGHTPLTDNCPIIEGQCFYDGSGLNAQPVMDRLIAEGHSAVWEELDRYFKLIFLDD